MRSESGPPLTLDLLHRIWIAGKIKHWILDSALLLFCALFGFLRTLCTGDWGVEYPAEEHAHTIDCHSHGGDEIGSQADLVVVVDQAVATTTVKLPIHTAGVKYHSKENGSWY